MQHLAPTIPSSLVPVIWNGASPASRCSVHILILCSLSLDYLSTVSVSYSFDRSLLCVLLTVLVSAVDDTTQKGKSMRLRQNDCLFENDLKDIYSHRDNLGIYGLQRDPPRMGHKHVPFRLTPIMSHCAIAGVPCFRT